MRAQSLGLEDPLERKMSIHSSILPQEDPWTEEPAGPQSTGLDTTEHLSTHNGNTGHINLRRKNRLT